MNDGGLLDAIRILCGLGLIAHLRKQQLECQSLTSSEPIFPLSMSVSCGCFRSMSPVSDPSRTCKKDTIDTLVLY